MLQFLNPAVRLDDIRRQIESVTTYEDIESRRVPILNGAVLINDFLQPEARQQLEGHVYSSGTDLARVYKTSKTGFGDNEINITEADRQIPLFADLREELDRFMEKVIGRRPSMHVMQLRELTPKESGHSRHVDYERGFDVVDRNGRREIITSWSISLPISWNGGRAPVFVMETEAGDVLQEQPASLAIFGPRIFHAHPPTTEFDRPFLWLVSQAFFRFPVDEADVPSPESPEATGTLSAWLRGLVTDASALALIRQSEERIRLAYRELLSGYAIDTAKLLNEVERVTAHQGIVAVRNIEFTSLCGHHFLPFSGTVDVLYEPNEIITGLGKIPRLVQAFARRFQIQELLVRDIAEQVSTSISAKGVYVTSKAIHMCMQGRGPLSPGAETVCTYAIGSLSHMQNTI